MDRDTASKIMTVALACTEPLNSIDALLPGMEEDQRRLWGERLGEVAMVIYEQLMRPVIREYRDLDPDF